LIKSNSKILYITEGETDKKVIDSLKSKYLISGQVKVQNPATKNLSRIVRTIAKPTTCILIFDQDVFKNGKVNPNIIKTNIKLLERTPNVNKIIIISQEDDLEDELIRSTSIRRIEELLDSRSKRNVKTDILNCSNLLKKLEDKDFNIEKLWSGENLSFLPENKSELIKK
jgi:hypothetical protein